uniref:RNA-dependent RNA polymerase n=1 Tax=Chenopodium quinoa TaxID=63459 RepID=A0A803N8V8_CHEQI
MPPHLLNTISVQDARGLFMHIHNATSVWNYMAWFSLVLSKTITLDLNFDDMHVEIIEDIPCRNEYGEIIRGEDGKALILTNGTGFISEDLALRCPHNCYNGSVNSEGNVQGLNGSFQAYRFADNYSGLIDLNSLVVVPPLLIQFIMFYKSQAMKGTVVVNRQLPPNTIQVRRSMVKVEADETLLDAPTVNSFEVVATSNKPKAAALSKNLIMLLNYGGVPKEFFLAKLWKAFTKPLSVWYNIQAAARGVVVTWEFVAARMVAYGIPLDEPYLQHCLSEFAKDNYLKSLKGGKLPVSDSFYLMGTADPTGTLNSGEVCVILDQGQLYGPVLVYRNPGIHPGDIYVVNARYVEDEIAGGDYDGDMYWVSTNSEYVIANVLQSCFSEAIAKAADWWLVYMDQLLTLGDDRADEKVVLMKKIDQLVDLYYDALDSPKKGLKIYVTEVLKPDKYPHHMGRGEDCTYKSKSILGEIHDIVDQFIAPIKFWKLKCFDVEIPEVHLADWTNYYSTYRTDMLRALNESEDFAAVYQHYRMVLYGGVDDLESSEKDWEEIQLEALAIYH